jgi:diguanylate cyclase (GGDEF)-like protein
MKKFLISIGYYKTTEYNDQMLYLMTTMCILVAGFYLGFYFIFLPFTPAIVVHVIYIVLLFIQYRFLYMQYYLLVKVALIIMHMIQLTLAVFVWFPVDTGFNLFYSMVPMTAFLVMKYSNKRQFYFAIIISGISSILYFASELLPDDYYMYKTSEGVNHFLGATGVLFIFLPMTYIFAKYAYDSYVTHAKLNDMAKTDYLTKVANRRVLFEHGEHAIQEAIEKQSQFSLILMDIDFFKKINDSFGHPVGDELLVKLTQLINKNIRRSDLLARYGGEEFAILLEETRLEQAQQIALELLEMIRVETFQVENYEMKITVSMGVTQYNTGIQEFKDMMGIADNAMYEAKNDGRNQVKVA